RRCPDCANGCTCPTVPAVEFPLPLQAEATGDLLTVYHKNIAIATAIGCICAIFPPFPSSERNRQRRKECFCRRQCRRDSPQAPLRSPPCCRISTNELPLR